MDVDLHASRGLVAVKDFHDEDTRTVHKYAVVEDSRRTDPFWSKHSTVDDLSKVAVNHMQSTKIHCGRVVDVRWEPDPDASRQLAIRGATVLLDDDLDDEPDEQTRPNTEVVF